MPSPSKEQRVRELIYNQSPIKHWSFEEIKRKAKLSRAITNKWIKKLQEEKILTKIKEPNKFPYYTAGENNPYYTTKKRLYALKQLYDSGLITALTQQKAKTIILFGSMAKGDWYEESDIDIFVLGKLSDFDRQAFESKLKRDIEVHAFTQKELKEIRSGLLQNVINGQFIKGRVQDIYETKQLSREGPQALPG